MYGAKSDPLPKIRPKNHKVEPIKDPPIVYVDECRTNFRANPVGISIDRPRATELKISGETSIQQSEKAPTPESQTALVVAGIGHYSNALTKDPYDPEATLKLALAYDKVLRRGCALKLLARLVTLENHPKFRVAAHRVIDSVTDNTEWFKGYRKDAIAVLNGAPPSTP